MESTWLVGIAILVGFVFWSVLVRRRERVMGSSAAGFEKPAEQTVESALRANRKIEAIKLYREQQQVGLKEAKEAVERIEREMRGRS